MVFSWSVFQSGKGFTRLAPKLSPLVSELQSRSEFKVRYWSHIESLFPIRTTYGNHLVARIRGTPLMVASFIGAIRSRRVKMNQGSGLRQLWHETRRIFWTKLLRKIDARALFGTNLTHEQLLACHELGIPSIEIQHGIMDNDWYLKFWSDIAPTHLACWPNTSRELISKLSLEPITIPYPSQLRANQNLPSCEASSRERLLVILSWGIEDSFDRFGAIPKSLVAAIEALSQSYARVVFRLHPVMRYREAQGLKTFLRRLYPIAEIEYTRSRSLVHSLEDCDAVLMCGSSSWVDSVFLGKHTITTSETEYHMALSLAADLGLPAEKVSLWKQRSNHPEAVESISVTESESKKLATWDSLHKFLDLTLKSK